jgi:hypothetical protein
MDAAEGRRKLVTNGRNDGISSRTKEAHLKKFLIVSLAFLFVAALVPQTAAAAVGVKGGYAMSKFSMTGITPPVPLSNLNTPMGGVFFGIGFGLFSIQPEILYVRIGGRMAQGADWEEERVDAIQVPVLLKINLLPGPISPMICGGPYGAYRLSAKDVSYISGVTTTTDIKDQTVSTDYGLAFGGGIDFKLVAFKLSAEVRYNLGLANLEKNPDPGTSIKNRTLMVLVGIGF